MFYVGDMLLINKSVEKTDRLKKNSDSVIDMKDLGLAKRILGMIMERDRKRFWLKVHQKPYLEKGCYKVWEPLLQAGFYASRPPFCYEQISVPLVQN